MAGFILGFDGERAGQAIASLTLEATAIPKAMFGMLQAPAQYGTVEATSAGRSSTGGKQETHGHQMTLTNFIPTRLRKNWHAST